MKLGGVGDVAEGEAATGCREVRAGDLSSLGLLAKAVWMTAFVS